MVEPRLFSYNKIQITNTTVDCIKWVSLTKSRTLRLSTCSNRSFSDETIKYFSRVFCRFGQSTILDYERKSARYAATIPPEPLHHVTTSLPKVIWEQGRVAAAVPGAGWHKGLRIPNVSFVFVKDRCVRKRAVF